MAMQKLNVRFSDEIKDEIEKMAIVYGSNDSELARAAMVVGLDWLAQKREVVPAHNLLSLVKVNQKLADYSEYKVTGDSHLQEDLLK